MKVSTVFLNILAYYRTGTTTSLSQTEIVIANNSYQEMKTFLEQTIILPNIYNTDTAKLFQSICEVFGALRSVSTIRKVISNPFAIPAESVSEYLKSYGFDIYHLFDTGTQRLILSELFNLYKETGTVKGVVDVVKLLGLPSVRVLEHWLEVAPPGTYGAFGDAGTDDYIITSEVVYGDSSAAASSLVFNINDPLILNDPLWRLTSADITALLATESWKLPAKTSYFSVMAEYDVFGTSSKVSGIIATLVASEMAELEEFEEIKTRRVYSYLWEDYLSFTELILAYTFCCEHGYGWDPTKIPSEVPSGPAEPKYLHDTDLDFDDPDKDALFDEYVQPMGPVRKLDYTKEIDNPDEAFDIIITEYNDLVGDIEASDYRTRKTRLDDFINTFTSEGNYRIVDNVVNKVSEKLRVLNEPFYQLIASKILEGADVARATADAILTDIQSYIISVTGLYFTLNPRIDVEKIKEAIGFIKPYRARPLVIATANVLKDPWDTIYFSELIKTTGKMRITCPFMQYDRGIRYDYLVYDIIKGRLVAQQHDTKIGYDRGKLFDKRYRVDGIHHDSGLYHDALRTYDIPFTNSNFCNVLELRDTVKRTGYVVLRKLMYDDYSDPALSKSALGRMLNKQEERLADAFMDFQEASTAYDNTPDVPADVKAEARVVMDRAEAYFQLRISLRDQCQSQYDDHGTTPGRLNGINYNESDSYDCGDELVFLEGVILRRFRRPEYDNECYYDIDDQNTFDEDTRVMTAIHNVVTPGSDVYGGMRA